MFDKKDYSALLKQEMLLPFFFSLIAGGVSFFFFSLSSSLLFPLIFLGYFAQLPLCVLSLLGGYSDILIAGAFGILLNFLFSGETQLLSYALLYVAPPVFWGYLRDFQKQAKQRLYPNGAIEVLVGQGIFLIGIIVMVLCLFIFQNEEACLVSKKNIVQLMQAVSQEDQQTFLAFLEKVIYYVPGLMSFAWMSMTFGNLLLAQLIAKRFKRSVSCILDLKHFSPFQWQYWLLAVSLAGALLLGPPESFWMQNLLLVALAPFLVEGIAILHEVYPQVTPHAWGLFLFYGVSLILGWPLLILIFLGIFEPWFQVRHRFGARRLYSKNKGDR